MLFPTGPYTRWYWSDDRKTRIRLQQWTLVLCVYLAGIAVMQLLAWRGLMSTADVTRWTAFNLTGLTLIYAALRSGWSRRLQDPSLTEPQMLFAIVNSLWCYCMSGEVRSAMLYPMMLTFMFGAFSLTWMRIARLTAIAVVCTGASMVLLHRWSQVPLNPMVEVSNFLVLAIMLPGASVVSITLGRLRRKLRAQRLDLETAVDRIQQLASTDGLTGLYNRRHAEEMVEREMYRATRTGSRFTLALVDLDHFKRINDSHGHAVGDDVLRVFAAQARAEMRNVDVVARWGGEEFLIVLADCDVSGALTGVQRLSSRIRQCRVSVHGGEVGFTMSAGVAQYTVGERLHELLGRADAALYRAKSAGRDRIMADRCDEQEGPLAETGRRNAMRVDRALVESEALATH